jgi:hypothetical protein
MAGLIARLLGGRPQPGSAEAATAGQGGYTHGPGPAGQSGFPGSTSSTRTFKGASPRSVKIESDRIGGFDQGFDGVQTVQASRTFAEGQFNPRDTPYVSTPRPRTIASLRQSPAEFYGGLAGTTTQTSPGNQIAGGNPLTGAQQAGGHSQRDTEYPEPYARQIQISTDVPGSNNVRNQIAERYKAVPGQLRTYRAAPRADAEGSTPSTAVTPGEVTVQSRFVFAGGGVQTYYMERQMPYNGRGDGGRGADLNGTRYYATGAPEFPNAGMGAYGVERLRGPLHRPTMFAEPAPWSAQYYDTTASVGTPDSPGTASQSPDMVYVSPEPSRGALVNPTGRG